MTFYFGIMSDIDSDVALASFVLTILFLATFDFCLGALEFSIRDNPIYNQMLQKIYKELMSMGFVNFVVVLITATNENEKINRWIDIIDFVGYMLFFVAIFFVLHSFYIMFMSFHTSKKYAQQHIISLAETLQIYSTNQANIFKNFLFHLRYFPVSNAQQIVEFKIIYALFRDTYWLPPKFDYGLYLSGCLERYSLQIINIGLTSWSMMIGLAVMNYIRLKFTGEFGFNCPGYHTDPDSVHSGESNDSVDPYHTVSQRCQNNHLKLFCLCGAVVCLYAVLVFLVSRFYVKRLLCRAGVPETVVYAEFLMFEESLNLSEQMEDAQRNVEINLPPPSSHTMGPGGRGNSRRRMSINTFRGQITTLRQESLQDDTSQAVYKTLTKSFSSVSDNYFNFDRLYDARVWLRLKLANMFQSGSEGRAKQYNQNVIFRRASRVEALMPPANESFSPAAGAAHRRSHRRSSTTITLSGGPLAKTSSPKAGSPGRLKPSMYTPSASTTPSLMVAGGSDGAQPSMAGRSKPVSLSNMAPSIKQSWSTIEQFKMQQEIKNNKKKGRRRSTMSDYANTKNKMKLTEDFSDVYFFSSPLLYFRAVEIAILLNSLYLSAWAVNFISVAKEETRNPAVWQLLMLVPLVLCVPIIGQIVKTASLLSAIAELEVDVIGSVLESMEDESALLRELRDKISRRLEHVDIQAEKREVVRALFCEIDTDMSGFISRHEFRDMLRALHLHYSDYKFKKLFNVIDQDRSGSISQQELTNVVFPEEAHDDDVKYRSKIVHEHMEVHKEKKKMENDRKLAASKSHRHWGRISMLTRSLAQFKQAPQEGSEEKGSDEKNGDQSAARSTQDRMEDIPVMVLPQDTCAPKHTALGNSEVRDENRRVGGGDSSDSEARFVHQSVGAEAAPEEEGVGAKGVLHAQKSFTRIFEVYEDEDAVEEGGNEEEEQGSTESSRDNNCDESSPGGEESNRVEAF